MVDLNVWIPIGVVMFILFVFIPFILPHIVNWLGEDD